MTRVGVPPPRLESSSEVAHQFETIESVRTLGGADYLADLAHAQSLAWGTRPFEEVAPGVGREVAHLAGRAAETFQAAGGALDYPQWEQAHVALTRASDTLNNFADHAEIVLKESPARATDWEKHDPGVAELFKVFREGGDLVRAAADGHDLANKLTAVARDTLEEELQTLAAVHPWTARADALAEVLAPLYPRTPGDRPPQAAPPLPTPAPPVSAPPAAAPPEDEPDSSPYYPEEDEPESDEDDRPLPIHPPEPEPDHSSSSEDSDPWWPQEDPIDPAAAPPGWEWVPPVAYAALMIAIKLALRLG